MDAPAPQRDDWVRLVFIGAVCGLCITLPLLNLFKVSYGIVQTPLLPHLLQGLRPTELEYQMQIHFSGATVHALLEWTGFCLALITAILAFLQYRMHGEACMPVVGLALLFAGTMDAFHTLGGSRLLAVAPLDPARFLPFSWAINRTLTALCLVVGVGYLAFRARPRGRPQPLGLHYLMLAAGVASVLAVAVIYHSTTSLPAQVFYPANLIKRPWDLAPLVLYLVAGALVYPFYYRRYPSLFSLSLLLMLLPDITAQLYCVFGSSQLYDNGFIAAHLLKLAAYNVPLAGLLMEYIRSYHEGLQTIGRLEEAQRALNERTTQLEMQRAMLEREVGERKSAEDALRVLDRAIASSSCGIIITDPLAPDNPVIYVNPAFERITGYRAPETIGRNCRFLGGTDRDQTGLDHLRRCLREQRECRVVVRNYRKDGTMFWNDLDISPVPDESGNIIHYIGIMTDITERIQAEEELRDFAGRLEQSNRELQDFVHVASHDLQEPLRKVQVFGDRLRKHCADTLDEEAKLYLERMNVAVIRMERLIKDLLTYSRVTRKAQTLSLVNLTTITRDVLADLEVRIEETGTAIELGELPTLTADPTQMRQLMQNLISNAVKFSSKQPNPRVRIYAEARPEDDPPVCEIMVEDNGIGFDVKYLERIFTVFQRLHTNSEYEGTGVGLTVCRKIVERHHGTITARSEPGKGATFIVTLPLNLGQA